MLVESTGLYKESRTQFLKINDHKKTIEPTVVKNYKVEHFGEGISVLNEDTLIELTWKEKTVRLLDASTLEEKRTFKMWDGVKEGWGITLDRENSILYVSDGSDKITRVNAKTLEQINQFTVKKPNG